MDSAQIIRNSFHDNMPSDTIPIQSEQVEPSISDEDEETNSSSSPDIHGLLSDSDRTPFSNSPLRKFAM